MGMKDLGLDFFFNCEYYEVVIWKERKGVGVVFFFSSPHYSLKGGGVKVLCERRRVMGMW